MKLEIIKLPFKIKRTILALGTQTKNRACFAEGNFAYLGPLHPDLSNPADFLAFQKTAKYFLKKGPKIVAHDLHPEYQSTKYAFSLPTTHNLLSAQHHHAHICSCMVENGFMNQKVIGIAFDGTGLGPDNNIWGAEFFICNYRAFKRAAHLRSIPLLGGEKAISQPERILFAWLYSVYKDKFLDSGIDLVRGIDKVKWQLLKKLYLTGFNSPLASSMGRIFDAVASLVLGKGRADFEAELAIELENIAKRCTLNAICYKFEILKDKDGDIIDPSQMFKGIILDLKSGKPKERIAYQFHLTVAHMIQKVCLILRKENGINKVVLSGGVFQNNLLLRMALDLLYKEDFKVFTHKKLVCNDSSVSLGQAAIANFIN